MGILLILQEGEEVSEDPRLFRKQRRQQKCEVGLDNTRVASGKEEGGDLTATLSFIDGCLALGQQDGNVNLTAPLDLGKRGTHLGPLFLRNLWVCSYTRTRRY